MMMALAPAALATLLPLSVVFACSPGPPRLTLQPDQATPGEPVSVVGTGFAPDAGTVTVRLNGLAGPILWSGAPDGDGAVRFAFATPMVPAGFDFINAYAGGASAAMGPTHASFRVMAQAEPATWSPPPVPTGPQTPVIAQHPAAHAPGARGWAAVAVVVLLLAAAGAAVGVAWPGRRRRMLHRAPSAGDGAVQTLSVPEPPADPGHVADPGQMVWTTSIVAGRARIVSVSIDSGAHEDSDEASCVRAATTLST